MDQSVLKKILKNLNTELQLQTKLLEVLSQERTEIVYLKVDELDKIRERKENVLLKISENKGIRDQVIGPLAQLLPRGEKLSLGKFFEKSGKELETGYKKISKELKKVAEAANKINQENSDLLKQSLGLVSSTISILTAKPNIQNVNYSRDGKVNDQSEEMPLSKLSSASSFNRSA